MRRRPPSTTRTATQLPCTTLFRSVIGPCDDPGFSWSPIHAVGGMMVTATFYSDIRVPLTNVVGELNGVWSLITAQLNHERVALAALGGRMIQLWEDVLAWAKENGVAEQDRKSTRLNSRH